MRSFMLSLTICLALIGTGAAQTAPISISRATRWKAILDIADETAVRIKEVKEDGKDPKFFTQTVTTFLSYTDVVVAAYYAPGTLGQVDTLARSTEIGVLGKALFEYNVRRDPRLGDKLCLYEPCGNRTLIYPLTTAALGVSDEPIKKKTPSSYRIIYEN
jgi:hypothetical protein